MDKNYNYNLIIIKSKNRRFSIFWQINIIFFAYLIPYILSNSIKITLEQENQGIIPILNFIYTRSCPNNLKVDGELYQFYYEDEKCNPYLYKGVHILELEWNHPIIDCSFMFRDIIDIIEIDLTNFDASNVRCMGYMFQNSFFTKSNYAFYKS